MGLAWQQGPLAAGAAGRFLVPDPLPERLLYAEPLRRWMRVRFGGTWIADSLISFEPDKIEVHLDGARLRLEPGQSVIPHGPDRDLTTDELAPGVPGCRASDRRAAPDAGAAVGQRRDAQGRALARQDRLHGRLEGRR